MSIYQDFEYSKAIQNDWKTFCFDDGKYTQYTFTYLHSWTYVDRDRSSSQNDSFWTQKYILFNSQNAFYCSKEEAKTTTTTKHNILLFCLHFQNRFQRIRLHAIQNSGVSETLIPSIHIKMFKCFVYVDDSIKYYTIFLLYCSIVSYWAFSFIYSSIQCNCMIIVGIS